MGLYTIDESWKERERRERRRHERIRWAITIAEIALLGGMAAGLVFFARWLGI